jgi:hypothetical protein
MLSSIEMKRVTKNSVTFDGSIFKAGGGSPVKGNQVIAVSLREL